MPGRKTPLVTGQTYHLYNRGVENRPTFTDVREHRRFIKTIEFYQFGNPPVRFFQFLEFSSKRRAGILEGLYRKGKKLVSLNCFCLMPNHFHFLVRQEKDDGISKFMSQIQNSYTRYFNVRHKRIGSLFQGQFKAVRVSTDKQLLHLSRYIHLNPYSSFVVKSTDDLGNYAWSSFSDFISKKRHRFLETRLVLDFFKKTADYKTFVLNQADYQRKLDVIKHLVLD